MTAPAAIRAVFSEWRMVKTRKVLALIFEVPLEQQAEVLTMLGAPMPDAEIWCAIARLNSAVSENPQEGEKPSAASQRGKERYLESTPSQQALIRAARLPKDDRFRAWLASKWGVSSVTEEGAISFIQRQCCHGESRSLIAEDPVCYDMFLRLETDWKLGTHLLPEPR